MTIKNLMHFEISINLHFFWKS